MLKYTINMFLVVIWLSSSALVADDLYFYTEESVQVQLVPQDSVVTVLLNEGAKSWESIWETEPGLNSAIDPELIADGFYKLRLRDGYNVDVVVSNLRTLEEIHVANYCYLDPNGSPIYLTNSLLCNFHPNTTAGELDSILAHYDVTIEKALFSDQYYLHLTLMENAELDVLSTANRLHESSLVRWAKADMVLPLEFHSIPNDPLWSEQWYFQNTGQTGGSSDADIDLDEARDYALPTTPIIVALMDDGVEGHPDFPAGRLEDGWDYFYNNSDEAPHGDGYHGMSVLGIIAASESNGAGICGMTRYNVRVLGMKIVDEYWPPDPTHFASDGRLATAFSDAVQKGAKVINVSWGCVNCGAVYPLSTSWIRKADSAGVLVVVSSGNYAPQTLSWPANTPEVLTIGASDSTDTRWNYSQYGAELDVVAPSGNRLYYLAGQWQDKGYMWSLDRVGGYGINDPWSPWNCSPQDFDYNCVFGGTSAAAAQATGVSVLLMLRRPDLVGNTAQIREILRHSSEDKGASGWDQYYGWGRLNAARALLAVVRGDANNDGVITISDAYYIINNIFGGGPFPVPNILTGDADCNGLLTISDAVYLITYVFGGGPAPGICFEY